MLPLVLGVIMFGLGMGLTLADFRRVAHHPRAVVVALGCQLVLLPGLCFMLVIAFDLRPALAVGMMLLAASPGGTLASVYSHVFDGDVALNITLTAVNAVIAVFTLPLVVNLSLSYFMGDTESLGLRFEKTLQVFAMVLVPVAVGMVVRARSRAFALRCERPLKVVSVVVLFAVVVGALVMERSHAGDYFRDVGLVALLFSLTSLTVGYGASRLARVSHRQSVAACMEIGVHHTTLALAIALSPALLDSTEMAVPSAVYGILMLVTTALAGLLLRRLAPRGEDAPEPSLAVRD